MAKSKPAYTVRYGGVQLSVWENETEKYGVQYSITIKKSYKQGDGWKDTANFKGNDLPFIVAGCQDVFKFLYSKSAEKGKGAEKDF